MRIPRALSALLVAWLLATPLAHAAGEIGNPVADPRAVVTAGQARFTVLTSQMVRMEWSPKRKFEDHATLVFINRQLPVPAFSQRREHGWLVLKTEKLTLRYRVKDGRFSPANLNVQFELNGKPVTWRPGMSDSGNLRGTLRTLDGVKGSTEMEPGLLSRDGWVLIDDSERPLFDNSDWPWVMARNPEQAAEAKKEKDAEAAKQKTGEASNAPSSQVEAARKGNVFAGKTKEEIEAERRSTQVAVTNPNAAQDWYLFAYGHDYKRALHDFTRVAGTIPLPPRFAFGAWWSRYWSYTDQEFMDLVRQFQAHDVPLDVLVIDMDWHPTFGVKWWEAREDQSGHRLGWTGYSWNRTLFPDPPAFLRWVHEQGLKVPLNLHPASGVQPHEDAYPAMARAMGIDPATKQYVPFDIASKKFTQNYFQYLHHPLEQQGIDFWWLDWQQEHKTSLPGVNPTWWLNYVHFTEMERQGKRGIILHRWGGLGNHRYQLGFSGDTVSVWESLAFQPYFTATAANVLYGYWSHDIGGHMPGTVTPELYTRWIQFGVFSPILRTHTTKNPESDRRIWTYPAKYARVMREAFLLRYALIPYIYTAARQAHESGVALLRPMYYDWPEAPEAYKAKDQYMFGDDMLVAPVIAAANEATELATVSLWLPPGEWIEWATGARMRGPAQVERRYLIDQIPVFIKAGAVIPLQPKMHHTGEHAVDPLILSVFPGASGSTRVYEDDGSSLGYKSGDFAWTPVRQTTSANGLTQVEILPAEGHYSGMPQARGYEIRLFGAWPPLQVTFNGQAIERAQQTIAPQAMATEPAGAPAGASWRYDGNTLTTIILLRSTSVRQKIEVSVQAAGEPASPLLQGVAGRLARLQAAMTDLNHTWTQGWSPDSLLEAAQTGQRMTLAPASARTELEKLRSNMPGVLADVEAMKKNEKIDKKLVDHALQLLNDVPAATKPAPAPSGKPALPRACSPSYTDIIGSQPCW